MKTIVEYLVNNHVKNTHDYVDLGLPSGTLWAKMNVGATEGKTAEDWYGLYFAWGETKGYKATDKHNFSWDTYKFGTKDNLSKYNDKDKLKQLENTDDAVYQITKGKYRMPTNDEFKELYKYTEHKWIEKYNGIKGLNGRMFTGNNGNTLFIPASGDRYGSDIDSGYYFYLWSSILDGADPCNADSLSATADRIGISGNVRCDGFAVRGVLY